MTNYIRSISAQLAAQPKRLFLLDALGALLTAFLLGVVLVRLELYFGMPKNILYGLSLVACVFMVYSFACYCWVANHWRPFLKAIALANLAYCCLTFGLVWYYYPQLTALGVGYFLLEIAVIVGVVWIEWGATHAISHVQKTNQTHSIDDK